MIFYVAEIVQEIIVEGSETNVVWTNFVLVQADSGDEAFEKALELGMQSESSWTNSDDNLVTVSFKGLHDLHEIDGDLEHGTELLYEQKIGMNASDLASWVKPKERLGIFRTSINPVTEPPLVTKESVARIEADLQ